MGKRGGPGHKAKALAQITPASIKMPLAVKEALRALPPLQRRFVIQYCGQARGNQTLAAKLAGYKGSYLACASRGSLMYSDERVRNAIEVWNDAYALRGAEVTAQLADLAQANLGPFLRFEPIEAEPATDDEEDDAGKSKGKAVLGGGRLVVHVPNQETWEAHKHWIRSIEADPITGRVTRIMLHDRLAALRDLAKINKLYTDAPVLNLTLHMQKLTDTELMVQLKEQRALLERSLPGGGG